ncbi:hypothetical protein [Ileibacterium valens]|uniref:hypothetical protein n=1 Tax=Ileibacterium valens TaxID=1862668 RepID=UPI0023570A41|nr:hypothetical protein [Ileibacterium valens]
MIKHKVDIKVSGNRVLKAGDRKLPARLLRWLFGDYQQIYLISPGKTIECIDIKEVEEHERTRCAA